MPPTTSARLGATLQALDTILAAMPSVFSTAQWGGRAYKVPSRRAGKPKLLAHVHPADDGVHVAVQFKLPRERAAEVVQRHDWVHPHSFRTLAPSGWVSARVRTKRHLATLEKLLRESRALLPDAPAPPSRSGDGATATDTVTNRIDEAMETLRADGWTPPQSDDFDS